MSLTKSEVRAFIAEADQSLLHWCRSVAPGAFYRPFSPYAHGSAIRHLDVPVDYSVDVSQRTKYLAAYRGLGKSSIFVTMRIVRDVCMERFNYATLASFSYDQAEEHLKTVQWQFDNNPKIHAAFGNMRGSTWRDGELTFKNGRKIKAVGANGQARGRRNVDMSRPDKAFGDDMESKESAVSPEQTAKIMNFWLSDVIGSLNPDTGSAEWYGTIMTQGCALALFTEAHPERSLVLELFDDAYQSTWPEVYSNEWIEQKRAEAVKDGKLNELWAEYRNKPFAAENQRFKQEYFTYWSGNKADLDREEMFCVIIADPGHTSKKTSDGSAIHVVGFHRSGAFDILESVNIRATNGDFYAEIARLVVDWDITMVFVDAVGVKEYLTNPLAQYLADAGLWVIVEEVPSKGSKEDRELGLLPLYKAGRIRHNPNQCLELESQVLAFPNARFDDLHDCEAYAPFVAKKLGLGTIPEPSEAEIAEEKSRGVIRMRTV